MTRFSANLGFLWADLPLEDAIRRASAAGFDAVEFHWPYAAASQAVLAALEETGLPVMGLNTRRGDVQAGENGLLALPGREAEAEAALAEALDHARAFGAGAIHAMAGNAQGSEARAVFLRNLQLAVDMVEGTGITILIEPLNRFDAPQYFLRDTTQAAEIIAEVGAPSLKLMFDCYHVGRTEGDVTEKLNTLYPLIGHIQFASVPDRKAPDQGTLEYQEVFAEIAALGWRAPLGAEYKPDGDTDLTLGWMKTFR